MAKSFLDLIHPEDREQTINEIKVNVNLDVRRIRNGDKCVGGGIGITGVIREYQHGAGTIINLREN